MPRITVDQKKRSYDKLCSTLEEYAASEGIELDDGELTRLQCQVIGYLNNAAAEKGYMLSERSEVVMAVLKAIVFQDHALVPLADRQALVDDCFKQIEATHDDFLTKNKSHEMGSAYDSMLQSLTEGKAALTELARGYKSRDQANTWKEEVKSPSQQIKDQIDSDEKLAAKLQLEEIEAYESSKGRSSPR